MSKVVAFVSYGQGGAALGMLLSAGGTAKLNTRIKALGVDSTLWNWDQYAAIGAKIRALPADVKVVVGGTSLGANEAPRVAAHVYPRKIDFLFGIQPSMYGAKNQVPSNVRRAMYFYSPWWWPVTLGFGSYQWQRTLANTATVMLPQTTYLPHPGDNAESVHQPILAEIARLLK